jgi:hypothetical protein
VNNGLTNLFVNTLAVYDGDIFAGTEDGFYFSSNNGLNWSVRNEGFTSVNSVFSIAFSNNYAFAGLSNTVWLRPIAEITLVKKKSLSEPRRFLLFQNYPNPFNPNSKIKFQIPKSSHVSLKVLDIMGKEIQTLVNENLLPGTFEVSFDGSDLPSGIYYYQLQAGDFSQTKKMVLIK